jgi:hypothetical protein
MKFLLIDKMKSMLEKVALGQFLRVTMTPSKSEREGPTGR